MDQKIFAFNWRRLLAKLNCKFRSRKTRIKFWLTDQKVVNTVSDQRFKKLSFVSWWVNIKMAKEQVLNILFTIFANLFTILYSLKSLTHILQWWNLAQLYLTQRRCKKYMNHVTYPLSSTDINIQIAFWYMIPIYFNFSWVFIDFHNKHG